MTSYSALDFDYYLPEELIATAPSPCRDQCRLLKVEQSVNSLNTKLYDLVFSQIVDFITPNDLLIFNDSKVIKARVFGAKPSGGKIELLIERILPKNQIIAHVRANKSIKPGLIIDLPGQITVMVVERLDNLFKLELIKSTKVENPQVTASTRETTHDWFSYLETFGNIPLPPYMHRESNNTDENNYQTVYAKEYGSVAAPTAGLHFSTELLNKIKSIGAKIGYVTLHVGSGTFKPLASNDISKHIMHSERYSLTPATIDQILSTKKNGGRIIAVGTTSLRVLETIAEENYTNLSGETKIYITPGFKFKLVDCLITNFHLPRSTLILLVSAFSGIDTIKTAYNHAIKNNYRFFSYGDAMFLERQ